MTDQVKPEVGYEVEAEEKKQTDIKLFGRWNMDNLSINDTTLRDQMELAPKWLPHT